MTTVTFVDLVAVAATSSGTGPFTLGNAVSGFDGVNALVDGATYSYSVQQGANFEQGRGTYVAATRTLTRTVRKSSYGPGVAVGFAQGAQVTFTLSAEDLADIIAQAGGVTATAKAAFNAYGLQWAIWFNAPPAANELLALYVAPITYEYRANFAGAGVAPPLSPPAATWTATLDRQAGGSGSWVNVGTIQIGADGTVSLATVGNAAVAINAGDRLRVLAPPSADSSIVGFALTLKGYIP